jgi:iron complex transport system ATP-binding protein
MGIEADRVRFSYGGRFAIDDVSLVAPPGELTGIIGANGSGKSTLLRILAGILPATSGSVLLDGRPLESYAPARRARHLAYVPQSHYPAFEFTVEQMVLLGRIPHRGMFGGFESAKDRDAAAEAIRLMDLGALADQPVTRISGGELQRTMLARALAQGASTLLLDEPTSHLDIAHQGDVLEVIRSRVASHAMAAVVSIHDLNLASIFSDRIIALSRGAIVHQGTPAEVLTVEVLREVFGLPLHVEPEVYGNAPAIRYHNRKEERIGG